jgi:hypothetical protein
MLLPRSITSVYFQFTRLFQRTPTTEANKRPRIRNPEPEATLLNLEYLPSPHSLIAAAKLIALPDGVDACGKWGRISFL